MTDNGKGLSSKQDPTSANESVPASLTTSPRTIEAHKATTEQDKAAMPLSAIDPKEAEQRDSEFWRACRNGNLEKVDKLLRLGADVNTYRAIRSLKRPVLNNSTNQEPNELYGDVSYDKTKYEDEDRISAMHAAIAAGKTDVVSRLLKEDSIRLEDKTKKLGWTALYLAVSMAAPWGGGETDLSDVVEQLLSRPDSASLVDIPDTKDCTPLHFAVASGSVKMARLLLRHGAGVNTPDCDGQTPLIYLAELCTPPSNIAIARLLLIFGADISSQDLKGNLCFGMPAISAFPYPSGIVSTNLL